MPARRPAPCARLAQYGLPAMPTTSTAVRGRRRLHVVDDVGVQVGDLVADRRVQAAFFQDAAGHGRSWASGCESPEVSPAAPPRCVRSRARRAGSRPPPAGAPASCSSRTGRTARSARFSGAPATSSTCACAPHRRRGEAHAVGLRIVGAGSPCARSAAGAPPIATAHAAVDVGEGVVPGRQRQRRSGCPAGSVMSSTSGSVVGRVTAPVTPCVWPAITRTATPPSSSTTRHVGRRHVAVGGRLHLVLRRRG